MAPERRRIACEVYRFSDSPAKVTHMRRASQTTTQQHRKYTNYHIYAWFKGEEDKKIEILRRYSDFRKLHDRLLRAKFPEAAVFRFPRKSKFHTHSTFTKERRLEGFNEYLQMLCNLTPQPPEVYDFVELPMLTDDQIDSNAAEKSAESAQDNQSRGKPAEPDSGDDVDPPHNADDVDDELLYHYESETEENDRELSSWIVLTGAVAVLVSWILRARSESDIMPIYGALIIFLSWGGIVNALQSHEARRL